MWIAYSTGARARTSDPAGHVGAGQFAGISRRPVENQADPRESAVERDQIHAGRRYCDVVRGEPEQDRRHPIMARKGPGRNLPFFAACQPHRCNEPEYGADHKTEPRQRDQKGATECQRGIKIMPPLRQTSEAKRKAPALKRSEQDCKPDPGTRKAGRTRQPDRSDVVVSRQQSGRHPDEKHHEIDLGQQRHRERERGHGASLNSVSSTIG